MHIASDKQLATGIYFADYKRVVLDAAQAFARNKSESSNFLPATEWPKNFIPDTETNNECGVYVYCLHCESLPHEKESAAVEIGKRMGGRDE